MKKRVLAVVISILILVSLVSVVANAADGTLVLEVKNVEVDREVGVTVTVPVELTSNPGYGYGDFSVTWDKSALTLTDITYESIMPVRQPAPPIENNGYFGVGVGDVMAAENYTGTGTAFTLSFKITENATENSYEIGIEIDSFNDVDMEEIDAQAVSGAFSFKGAPVHTHTMEEIPYKASTCKEVGNNAYYHCTGCGKYFKDADGETETSVEAETLDKLAHSFVENPVAKYLKSQATCTAQAVYYKSCENCEEKSDETFTYGEKAAHEYSKVWKYDENKHWHECINCGDKKDEADHSLIKDENGSDVCDICSYKKDHVHQLTLVEGTPATCTEDGKKLYYVCECGKRFLDATGNREVTDDTQLVIKSTGHNESDWIIERDSTETEVGKKYKECTVCHVILITEDIPIKPAQPDTKPVQPDTQPVQPDTQPVQPDTQPVQPDTNPSQGATDVTSSTKPVSTPDSSGNTSGGGSGSSGSSSSGGGSGSSGSSSSSSSSGAVQTGESSWAVIVLIAMLAALGVVYTTLFVKRKQK